MKKRYIHLVFIVELILTGVLVLALLHKNGEKRDHLVAETTQSKVLGTSTYAPSDEMPTIQISLTPAQQATNTTSGKGILGLVIQLISNSLQSFSGKK